MVEHDNNHVIVVAEFSGVQHPMNSIHIMDAVHSVSEITESPLSLWLRSLFVKTDLVCHVWCNI